MKPRSAGDFFVRPYGKVMVNSLHIVIDHHRSSDLRAGFPTHCGPVFNRLSLLPAVLPCSSHLLRVSNAPVPLLAPLRSHFSASPAVLLSPNCAGWLGCGALARKNRNLGGSRAAALRGSGVVAAVHPVRVRFVSLLRASSPNPRFEWDAPPASFACRLRAPQAERWAPLPGMSDNWALPTGVEIWN